MHQSCAVREGNCNTGKGDSKQRRQQEGASGWDETAVAASRALKHTLQLPTLPKTAVCLLYSDDTCVLPNCIGWLQGMCPPPLYPCTPSVGTHVQCSVDNLLRLSDQWCCALVTQWPTDTNLHISFALHSANCNSLPLTHLPTHTPSKIVPSSLHECLVVSSMLTNLQSCVDNLLQLCDQWCCVLGGQTTQGVAQQQQVPRQTVL